jgi:hypothetical protein
LTADKRKILEKIVAELRKLELSAKAIDDAFLAYLIDSAAGEAADQLRDDGLSERQSLRVAQPTSVRVALRGGVR